MFDRVAREKGAPYAVQNCDVRGVAQVMYNRVYRVWCSATALEYFKRPCAFNPQYEHIIHDRGHGWIRLSARMRQAHRKSKAPLVHVRTSTYADKQIREARKHYRKVKAKTGWTGKQVDTAFRKHFPKQWRLIASDCDR